MRSWCNHEGIQWFSRYKEMQGLGSWNQFLKISNCLKICSTSFLGTQKNASLSTMNSPQAVLKVGSCSSTEFNLCRGRWQMFLWLFSHWQMLLAGTSLLLTSPSLRRCLQNPSRIWFPPSLEFHHIVTILWTLTKCLTLCQCTTYAYNLLCVKLYNPFMPVILTLTLRGQHCLHL